MRFKRQFCALCFCFLFVCCRAEPVWTQTSWQKLEEGLSLARFVYPEVDQDREKKIIVLKIDPKFYEFKLLSASESGRSLQTLKEWAEHYGLEAVINASMFWKDRETSTGFMKNYDHENNSKIHPDYGAFLLFNPKRQDLPEVQILDVYESDDWQNYIKNYHTAVQNYRLISADRKNAWAHSTDKEKHSAAAIGQDSEGRIFFILSPKQYTLKRLNEILLQLPIDLQQTLFVEGGATAGLHVSTPKLDREWHGDADNTLLSNKAGKFFKIPNVIGINKK